MIIAVVFDLDNTLVDFMRMKRAAVDTAVEYMINAGLDISKEEMVQEIFKTYSKTHMESDTAIEDVIRKKTGKIDPRILSSGVIGYQRGRETSMYTYPKVYKTIKELLRMGLLIGILSDSPEDKCYNRLTRLHLIDWVDAVVTFDDTKVRKPSLKPFRLICRRLHVHPKKVVYIGDWPMRDIPPARSLGMKTIWARWGSEWLEENPDADYYLDDPIQILDVVKSLNLPGNRKKQHRI